MDETCGNTPNTASDEMDVEGGRTVTGTTENAHQGALYSGAIVDGQESCKEKYREFLCAFHSVSLHCHLSEPRDIDQNSRIRTGTWLSAMDCVQT